MNTHKMVADNHTDIYTYTHISDALLVTKCKVKKPMCPEHTASEPVFMHCLEQGHPTEQNRRSAIILDFLVATVNKV